jgi:hypothetical protein
MQAAISGTLQFFPVSLFQQLLSQDSLTLKIKNFAPLSV